MIFATSAILALLPFAIAQTSTSCNPTEKQCPSDPGFPANTVFNFQESGPGNAWTVLGNPEMISQDSSGLKFTINATGQAPTLASKGLFSLSFAVAYIRLYFLWIDYGHT